MEVLWGVRVRWCVVALVALLLAGVVECRREDVGPSSSSASMLRLGRQFGADAGARLTLSLTLDVEEEQQFGYVVAYTPEQYQRAVYYGDYVCQLASSLRYEFNGELNVTAHIEEKNLYHLFLLNCYEESFHLQGTVEWVNPQHGVAELALDEQSLYWTGSILLVPIIVTLLAWYTEVFLHLRDTRVVHVLLTLSITGTAVAQGVRQYYYELYKASGSPPNIAKYVADCVAVLGDTCFLAALLLMAMGWSIVRTRLNVRHKQLLWGATLLYMGFDLAYLLCTFPENLCAVYMLFFVVIQFLILFTMVIALNAECEFVRMEFDSGDERRRSLGEKLHVFLRLRRLLIVLMVVPVASLVLQFFLLSWDEDWIPTAINESLFMVAFWIVGFSFRPRARANDLLFVRRRVRNAQGEEEALRGEEEDGNDEEEDDEEIDGDGEEDQGGPSFDHFDEEAFLREMEPNGIPMEEIAQAEDPQEEPEEPGELV